MIHCPEAAGEFHYRGIQFQITPDNVTSQKERVGEEKELGRGRGEKMESGRWRGGSKYALL